MEDLQKGFDDYDDADADADADYHDDDDDDDDDGDDDDDDDDDMALDGDEDHDYQTRSKAMRLTAFRSDAFRRVPKRGPNLKIRILQVSWLGHWNPA